MKQVDTEPGSQYSVDSAAGCTVSTPAGQVICRVMPGIIGSFMASGYVTCFSDDAAGVTLVASGTPGGTGGQPMQISQALDAANRAEAAREKAVDAKDEAVLAMGDAVKAKADAEAAKMEAQTAESNAAAAQAGAESARDEAAAAQAVAEEKAVSAAAAAEECARLLGCVDVELVRPVVISVVQRAIDERVPEDVGSRIDVAWDGRLVVRVDPADDYVQRDVSTAVERGVPPAVGAVLVWEKYKGCKSNADLLAVNADFVNDLTAAGEWFYSLESLTSANISWSTGIFNKSPMRVFCAPTPALRNAAGMFGGTANLERVEMDFSRVTNVTALFWGSGIPALPEGFNPATRNFEQLFRETPNMLVTDDSGRLVFPYYPVIDEAENASQMLYGVGYGKKWWLDERYKFEKLKNASLMCTNVWGYNATGLQEVKLNLISLENADWMLRNCVGLTHFESPLPKLKKAENMCFGEYSSQMTSLDKSSVLGILGSIPEWTDGGTHKIGLGIYTGYQSDDDVIAAIAEAEAKGWTVSIRWATSPVPAEWTAAQGEAAATYGLRRPPIYARVSEMDGEQYLDWSHYVTDSSGYEEFRSVEAAREYFGLPEEDLTETE